MKRTLSLFLMLVIVATLTVGCASSKPTSSGASQTGTTSSSDSQTEAAAGGSSDELTLPDGYPKKDITVIVPSAAGGGTDVTARAFLSVAEKYAPVKFLVSDIKGGGGWAGWRECLANDADGYTLAVTIVGIFVESGGEESWEDFEPLCNMTAYPRSFVTTPESDLQTLDDVISRLKADPGSIRLAVDGLGTTDHLAAQKFERMAGVQFAYVPFAGFAEDAAALLGGNVELTCGGIPDYATRTDLKPLAIWGPDRVPQWPDVPTMRELGYDISVMSFRGIAAKKGTPAGIMAYLEQVFEKAASDPEWINMANESNLCPYYLNSGDTGELMQTTFDTVYADIAG